MVQIIDPTSVSQSQVLLNLDAYLDTKADALKWKDFFTSGAGRTTEELIAGMSVYLSWKAIVGRREVYLQHAENRSSNIAIVEFLGYSVFRGRNTHINLTVTPTSTNVFPKYTTIGTCIDIDLILAQDTSFTSGVQTTFEVIVGDLKTESISIPSDKLNVFRFLSTKVSEDIRLLLNDVVVPTGTRILEMTEDKYVLLSNPMGAVDVMYLNDGAFNYVAGDSFQIDFVELKDQSFILSDLTFLFGAVDSFTVNTVFITPEEKSTMKVNGPLLHETQSIIRGRNDYKKSFKLLDANIVSTNGIDISAAVVQLTYVKNDLTLYNAIEKAGFITSLLSFRPFGVQPPTITDPIQVSIALQINITLSNFDTLASTITADVRAILAAFEKELEKTLDFGLIEQSIEALSYVRIVRIVIGTTEWLPVNTYVRGAHVTPSPGSINAGNTKIYECTTGGVSASLEPVWPLTVGSTIVDGDVVWTCRDASTQPAQIIWKEYYILTESITFV